jgi:hypothetical protein
MFFEHIFRTPAFLTVFALFTAFSTSHIFCDSLRFFEHISSYFENHEDFFKSHHAFLMLPTYFFTQPKQSFIDDIDEIDGIDSYNRIDGIDEIEG